MNYGDHLREIGVSVSQGDSKRAVCLDEVYYALMNEWSDADNFMIFEGS